MSKGEIRSDDGSCFYFSEANILRLKTEAGVYRSLRPQDYAAIHKTLQGLTRITIRKVIEPCGYNRDRETGEILSEAPGFKCSNSAEATVLCGFLRNTCGLDFYKVCNEEVVVRNHHSKSPTESSATLFIRAVGRQAGIFQKSNPETLAAEIGELLPKDEFVDAAARTGNLGLMRSMLESGKISLAGMYDEPAKLTIGEEALHRFRSRKNLDGIKMLIEEYHVPVPEGFLFSVRSKEMALYLIKKGGVNPYAEGEKQEKCSEDGICPYFSEENISRLQLAVSTPIRSAVSTSKYIHGLRRQDYRVVGEALHALTGVVILEVIGGCVKKGSDGSLSPSPWFFCPSIEDAQSLTDFLRDQCKLRYFVDDKNGAFAVTPINLSGAPDASGVSSDLAVFIRTVGEKIKNLEEERDASRSMTMKP